MYELPATYELVIDFWARGECTINCTSGANMVLCPQKVVKTGAQEIVTKIGSGANFQILGIGNAKQLQVLLWKDTGKKSYLFFFQNGMRQSDLVSGPGRFSKALGFRSRLQWDSILPQTY